MRYLGGIAGVVMLGRVVHPDGARHAVLAEHQAALTVFLVTLAVGLVCALLLPSSRRDVRLLTEEADKRADGAHQGLLR